MLKISELREKRMTLATRARELLTKCDTEKRKMSAEELTNWNACHDEIDQLAKDLQIQERQEKIDKELAETRSGPGIKTETKSGEPSGEELFMGDLQNYLGSGVIDKRNQPTRDEMVRGRAASGFRIPLLSPRQLQKRKEQRATGESGNLSSYSVSEGFNIKLWDTLKAFSSVREAPISYQVTEQGNNLPEMVVDDTGNVGELLTENTQTASNADPTFTQVTLGAYMFSSKIILVSHQALQDIQTLEDDLASMCGIRIGRSQGTYFTTGTGTSQPLGLLQAAIAASGSNATLLASGTTTGSGGGGTTSWVYNDIINLEHTIDPAYRGLTDPSKRKACGFMFNDTTLRQTKLIKDSQGRPLWLSGFTALGGETPDTIDGYPFYVNQFMPNFGTTTVGSVTSGKYPALFAYFPAYKVRDVAEVIVLRLVERYADFLQIGYLAFMRSDAKLLQQNAVGVFQNSAS